MPLLFDEIKDFLTKAKLNSFISENPHVLAVVARNATIGYAFQVLQGKKVLSLPVVDEEGEYVGVLSMKDIASGLHRTVSANLGANYIEELELGSVSVEEITNIGFFFMGKQVSSLMHDADIWMKGDADSNLLSVITDGFLVRGHKIQHRIYVCDPSKPNQKHFMKRVGSTTHITTTVVNNELGSEKESGTSWRPTDVVAQSDIIRYLWQHREVLGLASDATLEQLGLSDGACMVVGHNTPALVAFDHMTVDGKSSVAIVDDKGRLVGNLTLAHLRDLPISHFHLLLRPVTHYLAVLAGIGPSPADVAAGAEVRVTSDELLSKVPPLTVTPSTSFAELLFTLVSLNQGGMNSNRILHRAHVVNGEGKPVTIITLSDVLRTIIKAEPRPPPKGIHYVYSKDVIGHFGGADDTATETDTIGGNSDDEE